MERSVMVILVGKRKETAVNVQKILTGWGCMIKTRLGIHDGVLDNCSENGLIILELVGEQDKKDELLRKLSLLDGVNAKLVQLSLPEN
jgi:hypothetical protein